MKTLKMVLDSGECSPETALAIFQNELELCRTESEINKLTAYWLEWHGLDSSPEAVKTFLENYKRQ